MNRLLWQAGIRYWLRSPMQLALAILSIALGVAVVVAVQLANESALKGFALATRALGGAANYRMVGTPSGVPQHWYVDLRLQLGIEQAAPRIEGTLRVHGRTFQLVGLAPLAEMSLAPRLSAALMGGGLRLMTTPGGVMMSQASAAALGLVAGETFSARIKGHAHTLLLLGYLRGEEAQALQGVVIADIATAQALLGQTQTLSDIDLHLDKAQFHLLSSVLPSTLRLEPVHAALAHAARLTRAFRLNLTAMSLLALLIGAYLVYNAIVFSVLRRGALISLLRAQGVTAAEILRGILGEAALLAIIGAVMGLALGVALGHELIGLVTRTINDLYFRLMVSRVFIDPWLLLAGVLLAVMVALLAALPPALEATGLPPRGRRPLMTAEKRNQRREPWRLAGGGLMILLGFALMGLMTHALVPAFVGLFLILLGFSLWVPAWLRLFIRWLAIPGVLGGVHARLALTAVRRSIGRTGIAVAALTIALAAAIGVGVMVSSFRLAVTEWLHQTLRGDYYVAVRYGGQDARLPMRLVDAISHLPGVAHVTTGLHMPARGPEGRFTMLVLGSAPGFHPAASLREALPNAWQLFEAGDAIFVSEPLAYRHALRPGDHLTIATPAGMRSFKIAAIIRDYASGQGLIMMPRRLYTRWWPDAGINSLAVYLRPGAHRAVTLSSMRALAAQAGAGVRANGAIINQSLRIFDQTFAITRILRLLLLGVAFVGVLASLMALVLERQREHAVLRALGVTPFEMLGIVSLETVVLGLAAGLAAWPLGAGLSWVLTEVINLRAFGWTLPLHLQPGLFAEGLIIALGAAFLAGLYPAWRIAQVAPAHALRAE